jgi:hypothetical protein
VQGHFLPFCLLGFDLLVFLLDFFDILPLVVGLFDPLLAKDGFAAIVSTTGAA